MLKRADRLIPRDGGEVGQELVERVATLQVVHERLQGNPGAYEDRLAPQDLGVRVDNRGAGHDRVTIEPIPK